jgi:hypothetical protein
MAMKTMDADSRPKFRWVCALVAAISMIVPFAKAQLAASRIPSEITSAEQSTLKNSLHPLAQAQFDAGRMPAETRLNGITIVFSRSAAQEADLKALIAAQQNQASPLYHQWLNPDQFAARFGMSDADLDKVENWLQQQGFSIDSVARSKNAIHFTGTVRQVEQAFSTEMHFYKVNGVQHFAPSTALSVPSALAPVVLGIQNLDDFRPKAHVILRKNMRTRPSFTQADNAATFFTPGDIAVAYDITPLSSSVNGAGQSITIVGQSAIEVADLQAFQSATGITPTQQLNQYVVPESGTPTVEADGDEAESDLDLEYSNAIAPGADINFVYTGNNTNYGAFDSIAYAIDENIGTIISSSYGECEQELPQSTLGSGAAVEPTLETWFEQAATQGQTVIAAAGDDGSTDCNDYNGTGTLTTLDTTKAVDYPASSPNVTAMGGTEINQTQAKYNTVGDGYWASNPSTTTDLVTSVLQYIPEVVWNDDLLTKEYGGTLSASGGGVSTLFSKPSWQDALTPNDSHRDVPDLALYASPNYPGYLFCSSDESAWGSGQEGSCVSGFEDQTGVNLTYAGGTSFDGPIFSGILALINQKQGYATGQGLINPTLYTLAANATTYGSAFHNITSGNNDCTAGSTWCGSFTGGYSAGTGYSPVSGLGSVDVNELAGAWPASTTTSTLTATSTVIAASSNSPSVGASVSFVVGITSGGSPVPSGTLTVIVDDNAPVTETFTSGAYTYAIPAGFATAGAHTVFAAFVADSTYAASSASATVVVGAVSSGKGTIALSSSPSTLTVSQGTAGTETITVSPAGGYTGTVYLTVNLPTSLQNLCGGFSNANSNTGDGVVPISSATTPETNTMTLDTNAADCSSDDAIRRTGMRPLRTLHAGNSAQNSAPRNTGGNPLPITVAFAGLLLAGFMGRASRKLRGLAGLILLAAVGLAVTACGSSVSNAVSDPPKGTYSLTVTGTDSINSNITAPTTFSFVIN